MIENQNPCANLTDNPQYLEWYLTRQNENLEGVEDVDLPVEQDVDPSIISREKNLNGIFIPTVFVKDGEPSADVYKKLFYSLTFKANSSSRARDSDSDYKTTEGEVKMLGGLVTVATDSQAIARENGNENKETRVPRTSQLTSVNETANSAIGGYNITDISNTPTDCIDVERDATVETRSHYLVKLTDSILNWIKDSFNKIKAYVDTVDVTNGNVTVSQDASAFDIQKTDATGTDTNKFQVNLTINASIDNQFTNASPNQLVSEKAIKEAVDVIYDSIAEKADEVAFTLLADRVTVIEGSSAAHKADQADLDALAANVNNFANVTANETISGTWNYTALPTVPDGATGQQTVNRNTLTTVLNSYVTTTSLGSTTSTINANINALAARVQALEDFINNLPNTHYTKLEVDALLNDKADVNHTHTGTYQPFVAGITGTKVLRQNSTISTTNGIITGITT